MVGPVLNLTRAIATATSGEEKLAADVSQIKNSMLHESNIYVHLPALCKEGFCKNGGDCLYPDRNCTCQRGWKGDTCEIK